MRVGMMLSFAQHIESERVTTEYASPRHETSNRIITYFHAARIWIVHARPGFCQYGHEAAIASETLCQWRDPC
jgi:hypothetical protein